MHKHIHSHKFFLYGIETFFLLKHDWSPIDLMITTKHPLKKNIVKKGLLIFYFLQITVLCKTFLQQGKFCFMYTTNLIIFLLKKKRLSQRNPPHPHPIFFFFCGMKHESKHLTSLNKSPIFMIIFKDVILHGGFLNFRRFGDHAAQILSRATATSDCYHDFLFCLSESTWWIKHRCLCVFLSKQWGAARRKCWFRPQLRGGSCGLANEVPGQFGECRATAEAKKKEKPQLDPCKIRKNGHKIG